MMMKYIYTYFWKKIILEARKHINFYKDEDEAIVDNFKQVN